MFPKNAWYVACTPDEIDGKPLGRQICGERLVFYRGADGVAALEDFCPHRGAPLSLGSVRDGHLVCGYHGLVMGPAGKCVSMPCQRVGGIPPVLGRACVRSAFELRGKQLTACLSKPDIERKACLDDFRILEDKK